MSSLVIACGIFACVLLSTVVAMLIARRLPGHHLESESRDVVKLGLGVIATLTALVLGLLVAATKGTYDAQSATVRELSSQLALLDRVLARYGSESKEARTQVRTLTQAILDQFWARDPAGAHDFSGGETKIVGDALFDTVVEMQPK